MLLSGGVCCPLPAMSSGAPASLVMGGKGGVMVTPLWVANFVIRSFRILTWGRVRGGCAAMSGPSALLWAYSRMNAGIGSISWLRMTALPGNIALEPEVIDGWGLPISLGVGLVASNCWGGLSLPGWMPNRRCRSARCLMGGFEFFGGVCFWMVATSQLAGSESVMVVSWFGCGDLLPNSSATARAGG